MVCHIYLWCVVKLGIFLGYKQILSQTWNTLPSTLVKLPAHLPYFLFKEIPSKFPFYDAYRGEQQQQKKSLSSDASKELPGFYVTISHRSGTLSHILYMCEAPICLCLEDSKVSFIYDLYIHSHVFSLGGQIGICGLRPINIGICAAAGQEHVNFPLNILHSKLCCRHK